MGVGQQYNTISMPTSRLKKESTNAHKLHKGRAFVYKRVEDYHKKYIDKKTGKFFSELTKIRNCPVCDSSKYIFIFNKSGGTYVKCRNCTMVFVNPVFKEDALEKYYIGLNTGQAEVVQNESEFYNEIYTKGLNTIFKLVNKGKILDVGCSSGFFLNIAKKRGFDTYGIELGEIEAEMCRKEGHTLYTKKLEDLNLDIKFDVITLWDVFEHLPDGKEQLEIFKSKLSPKGVIFMQIPSSDALAAKVLQQRCNMYDGVEHANLYNPQTIRLIAQKTGLTIKHLETVISEIAVLNNFLSYEDPYMGVSSYSEKLLDILDADFIHKNYIGYKMQVVMMPN